MTTIDKINSIIVHDEDNIKGFFKEYRFLSNFEPCIIRIGGLDYSSSENAYQAGKAINDEDRLKFTSCTPLAAKKLGKSIEIYKYWDDIKLKIMEIILEKKFSSTNPDLKAKLVATRNKYLEETNYWNDTFWGVCNGVGQNHLGKILMRIRNDITN